MKKKQFIKQVICVNFFLNVPYYYPSPPAGKKA